MRPQALISLASWCSWSISRAPTPPARRLRTFSRSLQAAEDHRALGHLRPGVAALVHFQALGLHVRPDLRAVRGEVSGGGEDLLGRGGGLRADRDPERGLGGSDRAIFPRIVIGVRNRHSVPPL